MFRRVLIANRGEIAVRVARTCHDLGIEVVAVYSDVDERARHVAAADVAVRLPGRAPADTYLNAEAIVAAARDTGAEAIHPGYGFLAESDAFARVVEAAGLAWVGPPPEALALAGSKVAARRTAEQAGVPVVPGITAAIEDPGVVLDFAAEHGFPVAIKAAGGGGGRGLKVASGPDDVPGALEAARREAQAYFGSSDVYVERYLEEPKHMEVQLLAPGPDEALWLGVRDCSLQRRHQKLIEETPPPRFGDLVEAMGEATVAFSKACGYVNAGTAEFLVEQGRFYFLELNARLQVEHTVTEEVYGVDLVACQLRIAAGEPLGFAQEDLEPRGHAIECRIIAEDPARDFVPDPGRIEAYAEPSGPGVRVDGGYGPGDEVPPDYDSLIAKLVTHGADREEARRRMLRALREYTIEGPATSIPAHLALLEEPAFVSGTHTTRTVDASQGLAALRAAALQAEAGDVLLVGGRPVRLWHPAMAPFAAAAVHASAGGELSAPMQGTILKVLVSEGDQVEAGRPVAVLEAMKMESTLSAPVAGRIAAVEVSPGDAVRSGQRVVVIEPE